MRVEMLAVATMGGEQLLVSLSIAPFTPPIAPFRAFVVGGLVPPPPLL